MRATLARLAAALRAHPLPALVGALYLFLTLSRALSSEFFLDGVTYAAVARNLALGEGSFWSPFYTRYAARFHDHPPLAFWLQAGAFRLFGDTPWVEFFWGVGAGALALGLLVATWRRTLRLVGGSPAHAWWPAALLLASPLVTWTLTNNLLENTLVVFTGAAVLGALVGLGAARPAARLGWGLAAGLALFLALLVKGPPGLFPLSVPLWAALLLPGIARRAAAAVGAGLLLGLGAGVGLAATLSGPDLGDFLHSYLNQQLRGSALGLREVASSRAFLVGVLARELALPALVGGLLAWRAARRGRREREPGPGRFFLAIALSASAPFLLFAKQMEWYLLPSLPFFALGLAGLLRGGAAELEAALAASPGRRHATLGVAGALAAGGLAVLVFLPGAAQLGLSPTVRDFVRREVLGRQVDERYSEYCWRNFVRDLRGGGVRLPPGASVRVCARYSLWRLTAYMQRYYRASLTTEAGPRYVLNERGTDEGCPESVNCRLVQPDPRVRYALFECEL